jgi:thiol-disulfide isomerase/thioredoxin
MMLPRFLTLAARSALLLALAGALPAVAQEAKPADETAVERFKKNPNDTKALNELMQEAFGKISSAVRGAPDEAEKALADLKETLEAAKPTEADAKALQERAKAALTFLQNQIDLARVKLDEVKAKLEADPADGEAFKKYSSKLMSEIQALAEEAPAKAQEQITEARAFLDGLAAKLGEEGKAALQQTTRNLASVERSLKADLARVELIGKEAPPITAEAWVNGPALSESDLKGKVVLLDFWAVWCGPCIATFPHLIEWNEKYADKGLVIVGLTKYYNYKWDDAADRASRAEGDVPHEEEQAMLKKFAAQHGLKHVFAVQEGNELSEFYGVTGIPQAVLIDRSGKVQLIKVGSGEANAKALAEKIEELINAPAPASE